MADRQTEPQGPIDPQKYVCMRADQPIEIDGNLNKEPWLSAPWTADFQDIEGSAKPAPWHRTRAKMLWDDTYFYVAAELEEPHVWATLTEHDSVIFYDNDFEVFIDPSGDNHEYYEFEINAFGTGWDLLLTKPYRDGGVAVNAWEIPGLKSAIHIDGTVNDPSDTDKGWTVELAFPWSVLKECARQDCPPKPGQHWRVNFSRVQWHTTVQGGKYVKVPGKPEENWVWSPQGIVDMHRPERWGYVQFSGTEAKPNAQPEAFIPDASAPAREGLHRVYYAQKRHWAAHAKWGATLEQLALPSAMPGLADLQVSVGVANWEAKATLVNPGQGPANWLIDSESRIRPIA